MGSLKSQIALFLLLLAALFCFATALPADYSILKDDQVTELFETWKTKYHKVYDNVEEAAKGLENFRLNLKYVTEKNILRENTGHEVGLNVFADLSSEEFVQLYMSNVKLPDVKTSFGGTQPSLRSCDAPSKLDWREKGVVTPVKNQYHCGSSWAFATTGAIEANNAILTGKLISLSEQQLVDCVSKSKGCDGGSIDYSYEWVIANGISPEASYLYTGVQGTCKEALTTKVVSIDGYGEYVGSTDSDLLCGTLQQPITVLIHGSAKDFILYRSGIHAGDCSRNFKHINHAILVVGYGSENGEDYWIIKNSWGRHWGMGGYAYVKRNTNLRYGVCGMNVYATYPIKKSANQAFLSS